MSAAKKIVVQYIDPHKGLSHREFSQEVHGDEFADKADQFVSKFNGRVLKDGEEAVVPEKPDQDNAPVDAPSDVPAKPARKARTPKAPKA